MTARTPRSCKSKGHRGCGSVRDAIVAKYRCHPDDVRIASSGQTGPDILLSPAMQVRHPFTYEVKFQERLNIWEALALAKAHAPPGEKTPLLVFQRSRSDLYVCLKYDDFLSLLPKEWI